MQRDDFPAALALDRKKSRSVQLVVVPRTRRDGTLRAARRARLGRRGGGEAGGGEAHGRGRIRQETEVVPGSGRGFAVEGLAARDDLRTGAAEQQVQFLRGGFEFDDVLRQAGGESQYVRPPLLHVVEQD